MTTELKVLIDKRTKLQNDIDSKTALLETWRLAHRDNFVKRTQPRMNHVIAQASAKADQKSVFVPPAEDMLSEKVAVQFRAILKLQGELFILREELATLNKQINKEQKSMSPPPSPTNQQPPASPPPVANTVPVSPSYLIPPSRSPSPIHLQPASPSVDSQAKLEPTSPPDLASVFSTLRIS